MPGVAGTPRITLKRLAEDLGVSPMTVSNAFNRPDQLSGALRERILARARELGYPGPDPLARGLRRGRTGAIGVISDTGLAYAFEDPAASAVLGGVCAAAEAEGLGLLLIPAGGAAALSEAVVDGVVVYSVAQDDPVLALALARRLPAVIVDQPTGTELPTVGIDDRAGAYAVARHLTGLGHRRFAVVTFGIAPDERTGLAGPRRRRRAAYAVTRARLAGYEAALAEAGIDWAGVPVYETAGSARAEGRAAAERLLAADPPPTAFLATSDALALGVLEAAPGSVAVAGFDDIPEAAAAGLTTVRQDHHGKGRLAGELLLRALRGESPGSPPPLAHELVPRASSGPARGGGSA
jgi:DNA-binding LacI/PurR family transcriptional regulator